MKKILSFCLVGFMLMQLMAGCGKKDDTASADNAAIAAQLESLSNRIRHLETNRDVLLSLIDEQVTILSGEIDQDQYITLPIYKLDGNTYNPMVQYYVTVPKNISLEKKVEILADKLSRYSFDGLPIDFVRIESGAGNRIAVINLTDPEERAKSAYKKTWLGDFFAGSSDSGNLTAAKLIKTFLQEDYDGEWIDGVKFLYNYSETADFRHIDMGAVYLSYFSQ